MPKMCLLMCRYISPCRELRESRVRDQDVELAHLRQKRSKTFISFLRLSWVRKRRGNEYSWDQTWFLGWSNEYKDFSPRCQLCTLSLRSSSHSILPSLFLRLHYIHFDHPGRCYVGRKRRESSLPMQMRSFGIRGPLTLLTSTQSKLTEGERGGPKIWRPTPPTKKK